MESLVSRVNHHNIIEGKVNLLVRNIAPILHLDPLDPHLALDVELHLLDPSGGLHQNLHCPRQSLAALIQSVLVVKVYEHIVNTVKVALHLRCVETVRSLLVVGK